MRGSGTNAMGGNTTDASVQGGIPNLEAQSPAQLAAQAQLIEALAMQSLQDSQLGRELTQALANHLTAQLGHSNAELLAAKGKVCTPYLVAQCR